MCYSFAQRTQWSLAKNRLISALEKLRDEKVPVIDLTESNPTRCDFVYPAQEILKPLADSQNLLYAPHPQGMLKAREAVARYYQEKNIAVSPDDIFLTSSTSEGYAHLFRLLLNPAEGVLFPQPSYPLFQFLGELNDARMDTYPLIFSNSGWQIDQACLRKKIQKNTKAIVLVNPNNPTGSYIRACERTAINELCARHSLSLISDEVFWEYALTDGGSPISFAANAESPTFVLGGLSKTLGLPQMKLSWIVLSGPARWKREAKARLEVIADTYLSVNTPVQHALADWFACKEKIQSQILTRTRRNLSFIQEQLRENSECRILSPEGGWYAAIEIPGRLSEEAWALEFLTKDHVFVHPGYFFDFEQEAYIILSLLPAEPLFRDGLRRILQRIAMICW